MKAKDLCKMMLVNGINWELESNDEVYMDGVNVVGYLEKVLKINDLEQDLLLDELMAYEEDNTPDVNKQVEIVIDFLEAHGRFE